MAKETAISEEKVVICQELDHVGVITLNRPRQLNVISDETVVLLAEHLEKWEKDNNTELILIKGAGRAFSAGGDLRMFYDGRNKKDSCLEVAYRMYWLCYHIYTYKKTQVALVNGISMGGGASLMAPMKFSVVSEKTLFATPEASIGFHTDCGFSYIHSHLPGHLGEYLALTGARLSGKELVAAGLATHFVPSEKFAELEERLIKLNKGDNDAVKLLIEEFSCDAQVDDDSILNRLSIINDCFSRDSVEEIIKSFEAELSKEGNGWIGPLLKGLKRSSPTGLKINLRSVILSVITDVGRQTENVNKQKEQEQMNTDLRGSPKLATSTNKGISDCIRGQNFRFSDYKTHERKHSENTLNFSMLLVTVMRVSYLSYARFNLKRSLYTPHINPKQGPLGQKPISQNLGIKAYQHFHLSELFNTINLASDQLISTRDCFLTLV